VLEEMTLRLIKPSLVELGLGLSLAISNFLAQQLKGEQEKTLAIWQLKNH
jgi:hypothetical protein